MSDDYISPAQLTIGLHVHLDLPWTQHPFSFSSFKIKTLEQILTLQSLGLERIRFSPAKSDGPPLLLPAESPPMPPPLVPDDDAAYQAKRARIERLLAQQQRAAACEREFLSAARALKAMMQNVFSRPEQAREEGLALIKTMADSMLTDADLAINLMKDKIGGEETYHHALNVTLLAMMLAKELKAPSEAIRVMGVGALFHDIGKLELPDSLVRKTEPLTKPERSLYQQHCAYGLGIAQNLGLSAEVSTIIGQHHEHIDGTGYPKGLQGPAISMLARMVALANAYDNLCNPANLAQALTPHEALSVLYAQQRSRFDATALSTFVRCMGVYPPGTLVVLSNESMGIVTSVNSSRPLKPTVLVYDPSVPKESAVLVELEQEPEVSIARTLKPQQLPQEVYEYLSPRKRQTYYFDGQQAH
jgi:putative nucleotidyltransferase with HDIG domain